MYNDLHDCEIRLVRLLAGKWQDEICCDLEQAALPNRPVYKALSYAWGSSKALKVISLNGARRLVTANLEAALRRIRKDDQVLSLWIDALSINQGNAQERSHQVSFMRDIYTQAEEVIVYLGSPFNGNPAGQEKAEPHVVLHYDARDYDRLNTFRQHSNELQELEKWDVKRKRNWTLEVFCFLRHLADLVEPSASIRPSTERELNWPKTHTSYQTSLFEALRQLMRSRWWNRIWVIQEIVVPGKVVIAYGSVTAPWEVFFDAARSCVLTPYNSILSLFEPEYCTVLEGFSRTVVETARMRELWATGRETKLLSLLRQFSCRGATDDRDKVFALLGLARDAVELAPDYTLTTPEVFQKTARAIIQSNGSLSILTGDLGRKKRQDLPSWVPDWTTTHDDLDRRRANNVNYYNASLGKLIALGRRHLPSSEQNWPDIPECIRINPKTIFETKNLGLYEKVDSLLKHRYCTDVIFGTASPQLEHLWDANSWLAATDSHELHTSGSFIDTVLVLGDVNYSDLDYAAVVQSWAMLAANHSSQSKFYFGHNAADAFKRTICADLILSIRQTDMYRRVSDEDMHRVTAWFLHGSNAPFGVDQCYVNEEIKHAARFLLGNIDLETSRRGASSISIDDVDAAIRLATTRRRFFITRNGYMGLGPASMRCGDAVYLLVGGRTPFVLRSFQPKDISEQQQYRQRNFHVVGDCYTHGFMDGEGMTDWADAAIRFVLQRDSSPKRFPADLFVVIH